MSKKNKKTAAPTSALALKGLVRKPASPVPISAMRVIASSSVELDAKGTAR